MTIIYHKNHILFKKKKKGEYTLTVPWESSQKKFWIHFPFPLLEVTDAQWVEKEDKNRATKKIFHIQAESVQTLPQFLQKRNHYLHYEDAINFLYDIGNQLQALEGFYMAVPYLELHEIIVVNDKHFFFMNAEKVLSIERDQIAITVPHKQSHFFSPEFKSIAGIPANISAKSGYYSLGAMIAYCLTKQFIGDEPEHYKTVLESIYTTKLFWALERLLEVNPENRFYLII